MINPKKITKEAFNERLKDTKKDFMSIFVSGSNIHPNPTMYKYYFWIYSQQSKETCANDIFYKKEHRLNIIEFEKEIQRLQENKISFAYVNIKLHRLGSIFNYEKLKEKYPNIEFALAFVDDKDETNKEGHK